MKALSYFLHGLLWLALIACQGQETTNKTNPPPVAGTTVRTIEQSIAKIGGKATLQRYFCGTDDASEHDDYDQLNQVATGSKEWVDLAVKLLEYSDAGCTENLHSYLGKAMQKQPQNVLPYISKSSKLAADNICLPFISAEISDAEALSEVQRTKAALLKVKNKALNDQCEVCLTKAAELEKKILADIAKKN